MKFMILVKATEDSEAGVLPDEAMLARMTEYHEELAKAGVLLDAAGLHPTSKGWRIEYDGEERSVVDGPFSETKELVAGYTMIQARSHEEALEWTRRFPNPSLDQGRAQVEVRQVFDLEELGDSASLERFRDLNLPTQS